MVTNKSSPGSCWTIIRETYGRFLVNWSLNCLISIVVVLVMVGLCDAKPYQTVVFFKEGSGIGKVGVYHGDLRAYDTLPSFKVDAEGNILVGDSINGRIQVFGPDGNVKGIIKPTDPVKSLLFPVDFLVLPGQKVVAISNVNQIATFDYDNKLLASIDNFTGSFEDNLPDGRFVVKKPGYLGFLIYDSNLQLIKESTALPEELGRETTRFDSEGDLHWRVEYPDDKCFAFIDHGASIETVKRMNDRLFLISEREIWILEPDNTIMTSGTFPQNIYGPEPEVAEDIAVDTEPLLILEYLNPMVGEDGNVYSMKRTLIFLEVVKWNLSELPPASNTIEPESNVPPVIEPVEDQIIKVGSALEIEIKASDPDVESGNDYLEYSATNLPQGATFDPGLHLFIWTPNAEQVGNYTVQFEVKDTACHIEKLEVTIVVEEP